MSRDNIFENIFIYFKIQYDIELNNNALYYRYDKVLIDLCTYIKILIEGNRE